MIFLIRPCFITSRRKWVILGSLCRNFSELIFCFNYNSYRLVLHMYKRFVAIQLVEFRGGLVMKYWFIIGVF